MARKCIFCGGPAGTNEHLWGRKVVETVVGKPDDGIANVPVRGRGFIFGGPYEEWREQPYGSDTVKQTVKVCAACNHGWMSDLEAECGPTVARMALGQQVMLDRAAQLSLARYAMKTAITHDAAHRSRTAVVPERDIRLLVDEQKLSPRTSVHLFAYAGPRVSSYRGMPMTVRLGSPTAPQIPAFQVTLLLAKLVMHVVGHSGPEDRPLQFTRESDDFRVQIFPPTTIGAVLWPPRYVLSDAAYDELGRKGIFFTPQET